MTAQSHSGRRLHRLVLNLLAIGGLAASVLATPLPAAAATTQSSGAPQLPGHVHRLAPDQLAGPVAQNRHSTAPKVLAPTQVGSPNGRSPKIAAGAQLQTVASPAPTVVTAGNGTSMQSQVNAFGSDQQQTPPDSNIAVGGDWVVETTNQSIFVRKRDLNPSPTQPGAACPPPAITGYDKYGNPLPNSSTLGGCNAQDLANFVGIGSSQGVSGWIVSDPRVVFDQATNRFYMSMFVETGGPSGTGTQSVVLVYTSATPDPTGNWFGFYLDPDYSDVLTDQPLLGFSSDKVTLSWDDFKNSAVWMGDEVKVLNKSVFLSWGDPNSLVIGTLDWPQGTPSGSLFSAYPLPQTSPGNTQYIVENNASADLPAQFGSTTNLLVIAVTGNSPSTFHNTGASYQLPMGTTNPYSTAATTYPAMPQPGSNTSCSNTGTACITPDDDRINVGVWQNGTLWTGLNDACQNGGTGPVLSCIRYIEVNTGPVDTGATPTLVYGADTSIPNSWIAYPSFGMDSSNNLISSFTRTDTSTYPSVWALGFKAGATLPSSAIAIGNGLAGYNDGTCFGGPELGCRWGDYSGAAIDPAHPGDVWVTSEYMIDGGNSHNWQTWVGRLSYSPPTISAFSPAAGPTAGGLTVTVSGSNFIPGTTFTFAGSSVPITIVTPDTFTFVTPAHSPATSEASVTGSVTNSLGTSNSVTYLYVPASRYHPVAPWRVLDTRPSPSCIQCGSGPLQGGQTRTVALTNYPAPSPQQAIPSSATAVVLNVTAVQPQYGTYLTIYPTGTAQPVAANINAGGGDIVPNLVTVPMGSTMVNGSPVGAVNIYNFSGSVNVVADVEGYYDATPTSGTITGLFHPVPPARVCDTRPGGGTPCNTTTSTPNPLTGGEVRAVTVWGSAGGTIPTDGHALAALMNVTAVLGSSSTYITVYPPDPSTHTCGSRPVAANINIGSNDIRPNRVLVPIDPTTGQVCLFNYSGSIDVVIDVNGWYGDGQEQAAGDGAGASFYPLGPTRICDTRAGTATQCSGNTLTSGATLTVNIAGYGPLPATSSALSPSAVVLNLVGVAPTYRTYLTLYPDGITRPVAADLNPGPGQIIDDLATVQVGSTGKVDLYNFTGTVDAVMDTFGFFH